jgi:hypothetical protein
MIYSNVTIEPDPDVLAQIGLNIGAAEFTAARQWMTGFRGQLNKVVTKIPQPPLQYGADRPSSATPARSPGSHLLR